jgi:hypothetical protein
MLAAIERCSSEVSCVTMPMARAGSPASPRGCPGRRCGCSPVPGRESAAAGSPACSCRRPNGRSGPRVRRGGCAGSGLPAPACRRCGRSRSSGARSGSRRRRHLQSRAPGRSCMACGTAIVCMPSCTTPTFSKMPVTSQLTQPATLAICQASGSAVATVPASMIAARPQHDADARGADQQQRVQHRQRAHEGGDQPHVRAMAPVCSSTTSRT